MNYSDTIIEGDCIEVMKSLPSGIVDLAFADPPYNLDKKYNLYTDSSKPSDYLIWSELWLKEIVRLLKPKGSFYLLNLPKWSIHCAFFLDQYLFRQSTIAWDALSTPRGKIMPAHYTLLYYTKSPNEFYFNQLSSKHRWTHCARKKCIAERKGSKIPKQQLTDIWNNVYRIKHRNQRHDYHPTQLPLNFMERIILSSSKVGSLVFDPFIGIGTTAIAAKLLNRRYLGIEVDPTYVEVCKQNIANFSDFKDRFEYFQAE